MVRDFRGRGSAREMYFRVSQLWRLCRARAGLSVLYEYGTGAPQPETSPPSRRPMREQLLKHRLGFNTTSNIASPRPPQPPKTTP